MRPWCRAATWGSSRTVTIATAASLPRSTSTAVASSRPISARARGGAARGAPIATCTCARSRQRKPSSSPLSGPEAKYIAPVAPLGVACRATDAQQGGCGADAIRHGRGVGCAAPRVPGRMRQGGAAFGGRQEPLPPPGGPGPLRLPVRRPGELREVLQEPADRRRLAAEERIRRRAERRRGGGRHADRAQGERRRGPRSAHEGGQRAEQAAPSRQGRQAPRQRLPHPRRPQDLLHRDDRPLLRRRRGLEEALRAEARAARELLAGLGRRSRFRMRLKSWVVVAAASLVLGLMVGLSAAARLATRQSERYAEDVLAYARFVHAKERATLVRLLEEKDVRKAQELLYFVLDDNFKDYENGADSEARARA